MQWVAGKPGRCNVIRIFSASLFLLLGAGPLIVPSAAAATPDRDQLRLQSFDTTMNGDQYHEVYRRNQRHIYKFLASYTEKTLTGWGMPEGGIHLLGAVAGAAVSRQATLYLNDSKSFAVDLQDVVNNDRAIFFALKRRW